MMLRPMHSLLCAPALQHLHLNTLQHSELLKLQLRRLAICTPATFQQAMFMFQGLSG